MIKKLEEPIFIELAELDDISSYISSPDVVKRLGITDEIIAKFKNFILVYVMKCRSSKRYYYKQEDIDRGET